LVYIIGHTWQTTGHLNAAIAGPVAVTIIIKIFNSILMTKHTNYVERLAGTGTTIFPKGQLPNTSAKIFLFSKGALFTMCLITK